jgi:hypothetical protein
MGRPWTIPSGQCGRVAGTAYIVLGVTMPMRAATRWFGPDALLLGVRSTRRAGRRLCGGVMPLLEAKNHPGREVLVERDRARRGAERDGRYDDIFAAMNPS